MVPPRNASDPLSTPRWRFHPNGVWDLISSINYVHLTPPPPSQADSSAATSRGGAVAAEDAVFRDHQK